VTFLLYAIGLVVIVTGLAAAATAIGVSQVYILGCAALFLAAGAVTAMAHVRARASA